jgi:hypothetical protein
MSLDFAFLASRNDLHFVVMHRPPVGGAKDNTSSWELSIFMQEVVRFKDDLDQFDSVLFERFGVLQLETRLGHYPGQWLTIHRATGAKYGSLTLKSIQDVVFAFFDHSDLPAILGRAAVKCESVL